jgi:formyl-CoA transferase
MQTALAITAAWAQKLRTGEGQFIEISMQEVMTMFMRTTGVTQWGREAVKRRGHRGGAPTGMYPCAPGGPNDYVYMLISDTRMWDRLCVTVGRDDLLTDPRFASGRLRIQHADELDAEIAAWTVKYEKFEAMRILCEGGVAASAIYDTLEASGRRERHADAFAASHVQIKRAVAGGAADGRGHRGGTHGRTRARCRSNCRTADGRDHRLTRYPIL